MRRLSLLTLLVWLGAVLPAQAQRPGAFSTLIVTDTSASALLVGCALGTSSGCTGSLIAGPISTSGITSTGAIGIASAVPGDTSNKLYNNSGTLYFNGVALATGSSLSGTSGQIPKFTGVNSVGNSVMLES